MHKLFEYIKAEAAVLKGAPLTFIGVAVVCFSSGIGVGSWHYTERIAAQDGQIHRYRVALGIDEASKGALIELNNEELRAKAITSSAKLHDVCFRARKKNDELRRLKDQGKLDAKGVWERHLAIDNELSEQFARTLRADVFNVDNELRRRLGPTAVAAIVGITPSVVADDGTRLDLLSLLPEASGRF